MNPYPDLKMIRSEMAARGFRLKRRWGQNFLIERKILDFIVAAGSITPGDLVLEVGVGPACLTGLLLDAGAKVIGIEIDPVLFEIGRSQIEERFPRKCPDDLVLFQGDFLASKKLINPLVEDLVWQGLQKNKKSKLTLISNLPYSVATPILINVLESKLPWERLIVTLQEEVADRFRAQPGTSSYGQVSVISAIHSSITRLKRVSSGCFWPKPEVDSSILKFEPKKESFFEDETSYLMFREFTRGIFSHRRKTWLKSLRTSLKSLNLTGFVEVVDREGLRKDTRAQELGLTEIVELARLYFPFHRGSTREKN